MAVIFSDTNAPRFQGAFSELPRGLVVPPPVLVERVAQDQAKGLPGFTDEYAKMILDDWTLVYYYEGMHVAYRSVEQGVEVFAVGEELGPYLENTPKELRPGVIIKQP